MSEPIKRLIGFVVLVVFGVLGVVYIDNQSVTQPDGAYGICLAAFWGAIFFLASLYFLFGKRK